MTALIGLSVVAATGYFAWHALYGGPPRYCQLSGRMIHPGMRTVIEVNGKTLNACCARCALTYAAQTGKTVRILQVTDFATGRLISASGAFFVDGSRMEVCSLPRSRRGNDFGPYWRLFDRCAPSLIAFASEDRARAFMAHYGGALKHLDQLIHETQSNALLSGDTKHE